jgi:hypothetical protein
MPLSKAELALPPAIAKVVIHAIISLASYLLQDIIHYVFFSNCNTIIVAASGLLFV